MGYLVQADLSCHEDTWVQSILNMILFHQRQNTITSPIVILLSLASIRLLGRIYSVSTVSGDRPTNGEKTKHAFFHFPSVMMDQRPYLSNHAIMWRWYDTFGGLTDRQGHAEVNIFNLEIEFFSHAGQTLKFSIRLTRLLWDVVMTQESTITG